MTRSRDLQKRNNKPSVSTTSAGDMPPSTSSRRPSVVDGKYLEPEWDRLPTTHGSFNQDTLDRLAQAQMEEENKGKATFPFSFGAEHPFSPAPQDAASQHPHPARTSAASMPSPSASPVPTNKPKPMRRRYYAEALSEEDKTALATGELNHNHSEWSRERVVEHHASRVELVPVNEKREAIIAEILKEKRASEHLVVKSVRQAKRFTIDEDAETEAEMGVGEGEGDQRASSTPNLVLSRASRMSPPPQPSRPAFPFPVMERSSARMSTYSVPSSSSGHSRYTSGTTSPPAPYVARPEVTFDNFLAPHASGKGETYRDSGNDKKEEEDEETRSARRVSKMPSMPQLKKRASEVFGKGQKKD